MPVEKFRSIEAMNAATLQPDASLGRRIAFVWEMAMRLGRPLPRGVRKFRSVEEMSAARDEDLRRDR